MVRIDATVGSVLDRIVGPRFGINPDALILADLFTYLSFVEYAVPVKRRDTFKSIGIAHGSVVEIKGLAETPCAGLLHCMATSGERDVSRARDKYLPSVLPYTRNFGWDVYDMRFIPEGPERENLRGPSPGVAGRVINHARSMVYHHPGGGDRPHWRRQGRGRGRGHRFGRRGGGR